VQLPLPFSHDGCRAAGQYKGPLHGIPWGAKDIISVKG